MSPYTFLAGLLTGIAAAALAPWLWRRYGKELQRTSLRQIALAAVAALVLFGIAVSVIYLSIARPHGVAQVAATAPHPGTSDTDSQAQSMEAATAGLAARLAREGGTAEEWDLLARSYDFMGRPEEARQAREHAAQARPAAGEASSPAPTAQSARQETAAASEAPSGTAAEEPGDSAQRAQIEQRLKSQPKDVPSLLALAVLDLKQRRYAEAREVYGKLIAQKAMTADAWADYADVLAALAGGSLAGESAQAVEHALALDPKNEKALWLKASHAHQEHRYADALALWKTLRSSLPADSPDARVVDANISEAAQLATGAGGESASSARTGAIEINGTVSIDSHLAARVDPAATLFIYAKAVGSPGPPLAVMRTAAGGWPVSFRLDDSMAMMPSRRLSQFDQVVIEARVSRSGQATPAPGDLYVTSDVVKPGDGKEVTLVISRQIG